MPKCLLTGKEIANGEASLVLSKHLQPGEGGMVSLAALKTAFNNTTVVEDLRKEIRGLKSKLGEE